MAILQSLSAMLPAWTLLTAVINELLEVSSLAHVCSHLFLVLQLICSGLKRSKYFHASRQSSVYRQKTVHVVYLHARRLLLKHLYCGMSVLVTAAELRHETAPCIQQLRANQCIYTTK